MPFMESFKNEGIHEVDEPSDGSYVLEVIGTGSGAYEICAL